MPIRFYCDKCHKPLEVTSDLAGQQVLCFHCKSRTNVPTSSIPELLEDNVIPADYIMELDDDVKKSSYISAGVIGLILSAAMVIALMIFFFLIAAEIGPIVRSAKFKSLSEQQQSERVRQEIKRITHMPKITTLAVLSALFWLMGVIFSLIGLIRRKGHISAIIGLVICSGVLLTIIRHMR